MANLVNISSADTEITDPTPAEIQLACRRFQESWSEEERRIRAVYRPKPLRKLGFLQRLNLDRSNSNDSTS